MKEKQCEKEKLQIHLFFPLQIIMSTTGKYSRAVCQSYRGSSKSKSSKHTFYLKKFLSLFLSHSPRGLVAICGLTNKT